MGIAGIAIIALIIGFALYYKRRGRDEPEVAPEEPEVAPDEAGVTPDEAGVAQDDASSPASDGALSNHGDNGENEEGDQALEISCN